MYDKNLLVSRSRLKRIPFVWGALRSLGIVAAGRRLYDKWLLKIGVYEADLLGISAKFAVSTVAEIHQVEWLKQELEFSRRMIDCLKPGDVVFDIGGNIGRVSVMLALHGGKDARVHAFEPEPRNVERLRRNVAINRLDGRITVHELALGATSGEVILYVREETGDGRHSLIEHETANVQQVKVHLDTATHFAEFQRILPDVVKIDVEGAEFEVLKGLAPVLQRGAVRDLFIEIHPTRLERVGHTVDDIQEFCEDCGMQLKWTTSDRRELHQHYVRAGASAHK